jgi:hypothetical protein
MSREHTGHTANQIESSSGRYGASREITRCALRGDDGILHHQSSRKSSRGLHESIADPEKGETLKIYIATYESKEAKTTVPVAAQSLQHAARKAEKEADDRGELVEIRKSKDIII